MRVMDGAAAGIRYPWDTPPPTGQAIAVAEGVLWIRLPLPMALDHVNIYALDEGDHWSIVDTGVFSGKSVAIWQDLLSGVLRRQACGAGDPDASSPGPCGHGRVADGASGGRAMDNPHRVSDGADADTGC
jgi:hypothetical protein